MSLSDIPLWSVKYTPTNWSEFIGQERAISLLEKQASSDTCPNMIFYGPPGTGKTAAALVFAKEFLQDSIVASFKHLNVRDLRSIPVSQAKRSVRDLAKLSRAERTELDEYMSVVFREVKARLKAKGRSRDPNRSQLLHEAIRLFTSTMTVSDEKVKVLVLDEADALDRNMQQALRRTMEIYSDVTRFILITPTLAGWSPAVISRCLVVKFPRANDEEIEQLITNIMEKEGVSADEAAVTAIARESEGDMRRAINILQIAATSSTNISEDDVYACSETFLSQRVRHIISVAMSGQFVRARNGLRKLLTEEGFSPQDVTLEMSRDLVKRPLDEESMRNTLDRLSEIDFRVTQSKNPFIQLTAMLATLGTMTKSTEN
jgi:replication factor C small subunit